MRKYASRRRFFVGIAGATIVVSGCDKSPSEIVETSPKIVVQGTKLALRGYQIVAMYVGEKLVRLPHLAVRIVGVFLVTTSLGTELVVDYLDDELQKREIRESITEQQKISIEERRSVKFILDNGQEESVRLGDNQYAATPKSL